MTNSLNARETLFRRADKKLAVGAGATLTLALCLGSVVPGALAQDEAVAKVATVATPSAASGLFSEATPKAVTTDSDTAAVELGLKFKPKADGTVLGAEVFKSSASREVTPTSATLWNSSGKALAKVSIAPTASAGWIAVKFDSPVAVKAGRTYTVSVFAPKGRYAATPRGLRSKIERSGLVAEPGAGVYRYGSQSGFPTRGYEATNYWVDVTFSSAGGEMVTPPTATPTPTPTQAPAPVPTQTPTQAPTQAPQAPQTPRPTPTPTPTPAPTQAPAPNTGAKMGWELTPANTGLAAVGLTCAQLPEYKGSEKVPAGTVIRRQRITHPIVLLGSATIEESCMQPTSSWMGQPLIGTLNNDTGKVADGDITIRQSEVDGSLLPAKNAAFTGAFTGAGNVINNYVHGVGSGISMMHTGRTRSVVVEGNLVHKLKAWGNGAADGNHSDGFTIRDFDARSNPNRTMVVRNNRFAADSGNDTGAFFIQTYSGNIDNVTITGNLLEGKGYQLGLESGWGNTYSNLKASNNRFSNTGWGFSYVGSGAGWSGWSDNFVNNPSATDNKGTALNRP